MNQPPDNQPTPAPLPPHVQAGERLQSATGPSPRLLRWTDRQRPLPTSSTPPLRVKAKVVAKVVSHKAVALSTSELEWQVERNHEAQLREHEPSAVGGLIVAMVGLTFAVLAVATVVNPPEPGYWGDFSHSYISCFSSIAILFLILSFMVSLSAMRTSLMLYGRLRWRTPGITGLAVVLVATIMLVYVWMRSG